MSFFFSSSLSPFCYCSFFSWRCRFHFYIIGSSGVNANSGSSRMTSSSSSSNSLNQQQSSSSTRQQSNNNASNASLNDTMHSNSSAFVPVRQIQLIDMPVEIFERIFQYTGYKEVSSMRLVKKIQKSQSFTIFQFCCDYFMHWNCFSSISHNLYFAIFFIFICHF